MAADTRSHQVSDAPKTNAAMHASHREMNALSPTFSKRCANFADTTTGFFGMTMVGNTSADLAGMTMPARRKGGGKGWTWVGEQKEWAQIRNKRAEEIQIVRWSAYAASRTGRRLRHARRIRRQSKVCACCPRRRRREGKRKKKKSRPAAPPDLVLDRPASRLPPRLSLAALRI